MNATCRTQSALLAARNVLHSTVYCHFPSHVIAAGAGGAGYEGLLGH